MSSLLDDLARAAAAEPMPRRRVMRILFGAFVGATVPAVLRPGSAAAQTCHAPEFSCECPSPVNAQAHFQLCCPNATEYTCECKPTEAICVHHCPEGQRCGIICCEQGETCADPENGVCCKSGEEACGSICCPEGQECAHPELEYCCPAGQRKCSGANTVTCCPPQRACCEGKCCPPGKVCRDGKCRKCPPKRRRCGDAECCKHNQKCVDGKCTRR